MKRIPYSYCIFYIERKYYQNINKELKEKGYKKVRAIIPTINVLKKTAKGKMIFEEVPILFNYGFIKMPTELAYSRPFLSGFVPLLRDGCLYLWQTHNKVFPPFRTGG